MASASVRVDGLGLSLAGVERVAVHRAPVELDPEAAARIDACRATIEQILRDGRTVYGVNTGFGDLAQVRIPEADLAQLQINLLRSHGVGVGEPFDVPATRAIVLLRANVLAAGHSGVRRLVAERLLDLLNRGVHPWIPQQGSVGASGDLAPLAHLALVLLGEGWVHGDGTDGGVPGRVPSGPALQAAGIEPLRLAPKEGLALINGTQAMTGLGALVVERARRLLRAADVVGAMTVEAKLGSHRPFEARLQALRPHPGQIAAAANVARALQGGEIEASHENCEKVQDAYSLRCIPQVHGAARDAVDFARSVLERELNAVTDNPTVFPESGDVLSGGNFHGQPVSLALDVLALGLATLGAISERRTEQLVNARISGLPPFLAGQAGLNSGFMMAQVTAAALASENKGLCHPASADSIPTSANQEDHVSMGPIAARKSLKVLENVEQILAIELLCATQGLDFRAPLRPADGPRVAHDFVRSRIAHLEGDRLLHDDLRAACAMLRDGSLLAEVEGALGALR
jgi:histidine ammonia-lyase